jgi:hypothetical protein
MVSWTKRSRASRSSFSITVSWTPLACRAVVVSTNAGRFSKSLVPLTPAPGSVYQIGPCKRPAANH